jgi:hypothetical protein
LARAQQLDEEIDAAREQIAIARAQMPDFAAAF